MSLFRYYAIKGIEGVGEILPPLSPFCETGYRLVVVKISSCILCSFSTWLYISLSCILRFGVVVGSCTFCRQGQVDEMCQ